MPQTSQPGERRTDQWSAFLARLLLTVSLAAPATAARDPAAPPAAEEAPLDAPAFEPPAEG